MTNFFLVIQKEVFKMYKIIINNRIFLLLKELIFFTIGMIICSFFFSIRFLKERLPQKIEFIYDDWSFLCFFGLYIFFCILISKKLKNKVIKDKPVRWYHKIGLKLINLYEKSLHSVYEIFIFRNDVVQILLRQITEGFYHKIYIPNKKIKSYIYIFFYFFVILPRILVTICFFIDVLIFHKFFYLYKIIWVLIIPLLWRIFNYIIKSYIDDCMENVETYFKITIVAYIKNTPEHNDTPMYNYTPIYNYTYKKNEQIVKLCPISEEEKTQIIHDFMPVFLAFLRIFDDILGPNGEIQNSKFYKIIILFLYILNALIWEYYVIKLIDKELLFISFIF